ncbi:hypothetical protein N8463_01800 [Synechococcus sp. AH-601-P06]|nr:hypothetical protein [Synechococcus sp. AH-601-P06]
MKILFLCPDYFFRDTFYEYRWIVRALASYLIEDPLKALGIEMKIYCGKVLQSSIEEHLSPQNKIFVKTSGKGVFDQELIFEPYYWNIDSAEKIFNASMDFNDTSFDALRQKVLLESIYMSFPATHIIHWGNNVPLARWCVEKNIKNYFVEMGFMRTPSIESLVIDSCGVNSLSTISKSDENDFICNQDFPIEVLRESVFESHNLNYQAHCRAVTCYNGPSIYESYKSLKLIPLLSNNAGNIKSNSIKVLIFLQLADDTQIVGGSGYRSMLEYLQFIVPHIKSVHDNDVHICIRFHPGSHDRSSRPFNIMDRDQCRQYMSSEENLFELSINQPWHEQIMYFHSIYTINSSIAFESWLFNPSMDIYLSGIAGWYPSSHLYEKYYSNSGKLKQFVYHLVPDVLKGVALFSLGGYLYSWDKTGKTLVQNLIHRIRAESVSANLPHLRFGMPGPGLQEVMQRASATSHTQIKYIFDQNFLPMPLASGVLEILNFLSLQELKYFNDIYNYEDNGSIPLLLSFERTASLLTFAWQFSEGSRESIEYFKTVKCDQHLQIFIATSLNQIICKKTASLLELSSKNIQYELPLNNFEAIESDYLYVYVFIPSLYDGQTCKGAYKFMVAT